MTLTTSQPVKTAPAARALPAWMGVWAVLAAAITLLWRVGFRPNADLDDVMKLHEIRLLLASGNPFDRTIPGVLQPEPMISHWPWIVDAPYALMALGLGRFTEAETALHWATLIVPPLLLLPVVWLLHRIIQELGFNNPLPVLALSAFAALLSATEFQPGRIDYHNIQMLLFVAIVYLSMRGGFRAAALCGALVALSFAVSSEMAGFLAIAMGVFGVRYVCGQDSDGRELRAFGAGLAVSGAALYILITPPSSYGVGLCDRYSVVHLMALVCAGGLFVVVPVLGLLERSIAGRAVSLAVAGTLSLALVVALFPQCLNGPYGALSPYLIQNWLDGIPQDGNILANPGFTQTLLFQIIAVNFVGIGAAIVFALKGKPQSRAWVLFALFAAAALVQALLVLRLMRVAPLLSGPGLALILAALLPTFGRVFGHPMRQNAAALLAPGIVIVGAVLLATSQLGRPAPGINGVAIAESCTGEPLPRLAWPRGSRLFTPPAMGLLMMDKNADVAVVAVPFHTAAGGLERVYRFFDPATAEPMRYFDETNATHVVTCSVEPKIAERFQTAQPLAVALTTGAPPAWLKECPGVAPLRVYVPAGSQEIQCPVPAN